MNGLAVVIIVGQLPNSSANPLTLRGFGPSSRPSCWTRRHRWSGAGGRAGGVGDPVGDVPFTKVVPAVLVGIVAATVISAISRLARPWGGNGRDTPQGSARPVGPLDEVGRCRTPMIAAVGIMLVSSWSRSPPPRASVLVGAKRWTQPGDDRYQEPPTSRRASFRDSQCRRADRGRQSSSRRGPIPARLVGGRRRRRRALVVLQLLAGGPPPVRLGRRVDRGCSLSLDLEALVRYWRVEERPGAPVVASLG